MPKRDTTVSNKQMSEVKSFIGSQYISEAEQIIRIKQMLKKMITRGIERGQYQVKTENLIVYLKFFLDYEVTVVNTAVGFRNATNSKLAEIEHVFMTDPNHYNVIKPESLRKALMYIRLVRDKYNLPNLV